MKKLTVSTAKFPTIKGTDLLYLVLEDGSSKVTLNVGQKTYDSVNAMLSQPELKKIDEKEPKTGK